MRKTDREKKYIEKFTRMSDDEFKDITSKLDGIKILVSENHNINLYDEIVTELGSEYKELMIVKEGDEVVKMLVNEQGEIIKELLILVKEGNHDESVVLVISGDIDLNSISKPSLVVIKSITKPLFIIIM